MRINKPTIATKRSYPGINGTGGALVGCVLITEVVEVVVTDTGQGIPPQELSRIFERFYQVDRSRVRTGNGGGSGLGLAIARELVEAHNGHIQAHSQVGVGSQFTVRLPIVHGADTTSISTS